MSLFFLTTNTWLQSRDLQKCPPTTTKSSPLPPKKVPTSVFIHKTHTERQAWLPALIKPSHHMGMGSRAEGDWIRAGTTLKWSDTQRKHASLNQLFITIKKTPHAHTHTLKVWWAKPWRLGVLITTSPFHTHTQAHTHITKANFLTQADMYMRQT